MAFWARKGDRTYVYFYADGRQHVLPRAKTEHLDGQAGEAVDLWVRDFEAQQRGERSEQARRSTPRLAHQLDQYVAFLRKRGRAPGTVREIRSALVRFVLPFFLGGDAPLTDPRDWSRRSIRFSDWLEGNGVGESMGRIAIRALRGFYAFLRDEGVVDVDLRLRMPAKQPKTTPLKSHLSPTEVLQFCRDCPDRITVLAALLGYFFALRPQEAMAICVKDFSAGPSVCQLQCSRAMRKAGLFDRLAVRVERQRTADGRITAPKAGSRGWVCCFDEGAARLLIRTLDGLASDARLLDREARRIYRRWQSRGIPGVTLKDLRRASLHWLGHNTDLHPINLQKHARHASFDTTQLYLRNPESELQPGEVPLSLALLSSHISSLPAMGDQQAGLAADESES